MTREVGCERFHHDLSAFVDGTLAPRRHDQVELHLSGCPGCREEVAALSAVCSALSACAPSDAPKSLTARLESIAGEHAQAPLYWAVGDGDLPSLRQLRQRRMLRSGVALIVVLVSVTVLAVMIAPDPPRLSDPIKTGRETYSMSLSAASADQAVGAVLLSLDRGAELGAPVSYEQMPPVAARQVSTSRAAGLLQGASGADLTFTGVQRVWIRDGVEGYRTADVRMTKERGRGARMEVMDVNGDRFSSSFISEMGSAPEPPQRWRFTESLEAIKVGGRDTRKLEAAGRSGPVAAWWIDVKTGMLLWSERYDTAGRVNLAVGYKSLSMGQADLPDHPATPIPLHPVSMSQTDGWCIGLEECPQQLAGLTLVAYSSSRRTGHRSMNLVYSDGVEMAVVSWTEGVLDREVASTTQRGPGLPSVSVWQSGGAVLSVTSSSQSDSFAQLCSELPGEAPYAPSLFERALAGFARLSGTR